MSIIYIVDDDAALRGSLGNLLKSLGYGTVAFASGEAFLASPFVHNAMCLLLDLKMKGMQGLEVQKRLNARGSTVPIVFMSAHCDEEMTQHALENGAIEFLRKPFSERLLLDSINIALAHKGRGK
jgi:FixJ family two-component response regulator